jgi:hypothetical protein
MARRSDHSREELREMALQAGLNIVRTKGEQSRGRGTVTLIWEPVLAGP